jgi:hypothetical protein
MFSLDKIKEINELTTTQDINDSELQAKIKEFQIFLNSDTFEEKIKDALEENDLAEYTYFSFTNDKLSLLSSSSKPFYNLVLPEAKDEIQDFVMCCYRKLIERLQNTKYRVVESDNIDFKVYLTSMVEYKIYLFSI